MPSIDLSDPTIQAALISGLSNVLSALIAAAAAAVIGKTIADGRRSQEKLETAIDDIAFLLEVEDLHCEHNRQNLNQSRKNIVRDQARDAGLNFSGQFTPGVARSNRRFR